MKTIIQVLIISILLCTVASAKDCPELMEAAKSGDYDTVKKLLDEGCNIEMINDTGFTPLIVSLFYDHSNEEVTKLLINRGADIHATDSDDNTVFEFAVEANKIGIVKILLNKGVDVNYIDKSTGGTVLAGACYSGLDEMAKLLIDNGAKIDIRDFHGFTALYQAIRSEHLSTVKLMIKNGADVNTKDMHGHTALMMAVIVRDPKMMRALIAAGADVNATNSDGESALSIARSKGPKQLMDILIEAGAKE